MRAFFLAIIGVFLALYALAKHDASKARKEAQKAQAKSKKADTESDLETTYASAFIAMSKALDRLGNLDNIDTSDIETEGTAKASAKGDEGTVSDIPLSPERVARASLSSPMLGQVENNHSEPLSDGKAEGTASYTESTRNVRNPEPMRSVPSFGIARFLAKATASDKPLEEGRHTSQDNIAPASAAEAKVNGNGEGRHLDTAIPSAPIPDKSKKNAPAIRIIGMHSVPSNAIESNRGSVGASMGTGAKTIPASNLDKPMSDEEKEIAREQMKRIRKMRGL